ncbi:MAG: TonB family protein [Bacteroidota bacterium]
MLNTSSNLYKAEWLNLVFKNRNQSYGAYALRSESAGNTIRALFIGASFFILLFAAPKIYSLLNSSSIVEDTKLPDDRIVEINPLRPPVPPKPLPEEIKPPAPAPLKQKVKMIKLPNHFVPKEEAPQVDVPTIKEIEKAVIGPAVQEGLASEYSMATTGGNGEGSAVGSGTGVGTSTGDAIYDPVGLEIYPEFEGGMKAWYKYVSRNLKYPEMAMDQSKGGKVFLSFVVERDGSISNVQVMRGVGFGMDEEATRVIKKSPKWKPGVQNGKAVRVRFNMPITFSFSF